MSGPLGNLDTSAELSGILDMTQFLHLLDIVLESLAFQGLLRDFVQNLRSLSLPKEGLITLHFRRSIHLNSDGS